MEQGLGASRLVSLACYALTGRPRCGLTPAFHLSPATRAQNSAHFARRDRALKSIVKHFGARVIPSTCVPKIVGKES